MIATEWFRDGGHLLTKGARALRRTVFLDGESRPAGLSFPQKLLEKDRIAALSKLGAKWQVEI